MNEAYRDILRQAQRAKEEAEKKQKDLNKKQAGVIDLKDKKNEIDKNQKILEDELKKKMKVPALRNKKDLLLCASGFNQIELNNYFDYDKLSQIVIDALKKFVLPMYLDEKGNVIRYELAKALTKDDKFIADKYSLYKYNGKFYEQNDNIFNKIDSLIVDKKFMKKTNIEDVTYLLMQQVMQEEIQQEIGYINLKNGIYDIKNEMLLPHTSEIITLGTINAEYKENCSSIEGTEFEKFILTSLGKEYIPVIQEFIGVCLQPVTNKVHYFYILLGEGRNGKGVLLETILNMIPECLRSHLPIEGLDTKFSNAVLKGKTVNVATDDPTIRLEAIGILKTLTSYEPFQTERKGKDPMTIRPLTTHVSSFNRFPTMQEKANAFWDRLILIKFDNTFGSPEEVERGEKMFVRDIDIKSKILKELDIIISWGLEGLKRLKANNYVFTKNEKMIKDLEDQRLSTDTVRTWLKENVVKTTYKINDDWITEKALYNNYSDWCYLESYNKVGRHAFNTIIQEALKSSWKKYNNRNIYSVLMKPNKSS